MLRKELGFYIKFQLFLSLKQSIQNMKIFILSIIFLLTTGQKVVGQIKHPDLVAVDKVKTSKMIVYGSDTCHYCIDTKSFLKEKNIAFIYYDVDVNLEKQNEMVVKLQNAGIPLDAISLPIVDLQGKLIVNNVKDFNEFLKSLTVKTK